MNRMLGLAAAAAAALTIAPASAEHRSGPAFVAPPSGQVVQLGSDHRHRRGTTVIVGAGPVWPSEGWALSNNRSWEADSYNDWWHDRPDRAYPRWIQQSRENVACTEDRMWWSGAGWRC